MLGLDAARAILVNIVRGQWANVVSLQGDLESIAAWLFGLTNRRAAEPLWAAAVIVCAIVASFLILRSRVRAVEIVR